MGRLLDVERKGNLRRRPRGARPAPHSHYASLLLRLIVAISKEKKIVVRERSPKVVASSVSVLSS